MLEIPAFTEIKNMLLPLPRQPGRHQTRGWRAQNHFTVFPNMVGMRVADKDTLRARPGLMRIEPQSKFGQDYAAGLKLHPQK